METPLNLFGDASRLTLCLHHFQSSGTKAWIPLPLQGSSTIALGIALPEGSRAPEQQFVGRTATPGMR
jgi:hypothetical protein